MSIIVTVYVPGAIVMASDSRQSVIIQRPGAGGRSVSFETINSDHVYKTFLLLGKEIGISAFGDFVLDGVFLETALKSFEEECLDDRDDVCSAVKKLLGYFRSRFPQANTSFHLAGFDKERRDNGALVYNCHISRNELVQINKSPAGDERPVYGAAWGGRVEVITALLGHGTAKNPVPAGTCRDIPILWEAMAIQDAIDFAVFAVRTTIETVRFQAREKNVGGPIDVLLLTPEEARWIQRKEFGVSPA